MRSFLTWALPFFVIAAVAATGVWMVVDFLGRPRPTGEVSNREITQTTKTPTSERTTATPSPAATPTPTESPSPKEKARLITKGVTVQVLNGTNDPEAGNKMAVRLGREGFEIVAVEFTSTPYKETTVFWSYPDARKAGEALASHFGWLVEEKPGNLADTVALHVVVGRDET